MINKFNKFITSNYIINYIVFIGGILLFSFIYLRRILDVSPQYAKNICVLFLTIGVLAILISVFEFFIILHILKIKISFYELYNKIAAVIMLRFLISILLYLLFYNSIAVIANKVIEIVYLIYIISVIKYSYNIQWKKCCFFIVSIVFINCLLNILVSLLKA